MIHSEKNVVDNLTAGVIATKTVVEVAKSVNAADNTVAPEVTRGSHVKAIWAELTFRPIAESAVGISTTIDAYMFKNPGFNLTSPNPGTTGTSNEKKFVFKEWRSLIGPHTLGNLPYKWSGWIRIPKRYQRMGTDDKIQMIFLFTGVAGISCSKFLYKWYS